MNYQEKVEKTMCAICLAFADLQIKTQRFSVYHVKQQRKQANPHINKAGTVEFLAFTIYQPSN